MGKYDISGASYIDWMQEKANQYNALIRQAERTRRQLGEPSKEEGQLYIEAAKVCQEIRDKNLSQRAIYAKWELRGIEATNMAREIADKVAPAPPPKPDPVPVDAPVRKSAPAPDTANGQPQVQTTPSGFTTKNAIKEVPAETIETWYKPKPNHGFDDVTGMEDLKARLICDAAIFGYSLTDRMLRFDPFQSYLFYGPPGTGKTFLIEAFARKMMDEFGFKFIQLNGSDIHASLVNVGVLPAEKTVNIVFQEAMDNAPCVLFIDEIERVCVERCSHKAEGHEKRLTIAMIEAYSKLKESGKRIVFMCATNHPGQVDEGWLEKAPRVIRLPLPTENDRKAYFERKLDTMTLEEGFTFQELATATEDYDYRDLECLKDAIVVRMKEQAIDACAVYDADGKVDPEQTVLAASEALKNGGIRLTRALFDATRAELPPSDKTEIRKELEEFEEYLHPPIFR